MTPEELQEGTQLTNQIRKATQAKQDLVEMETVIGGQNIRISVQGKDARVVSNDLVTFLQDQQTKAQTRIDTLQSQFDEL